MRKWGRTELLRTVPESAVVHFARPKTFVFSHGVSGLYRQHQDQISRRELQALTRAVRGELAHQHQAEFRRITWKIPGLVWSLDDAELARVAHHTWHLHQVQDLASRYKFTPWVGDHVWGEAVAVHLEQLFLRYGPPLVLKRDNASNLNLQAVNEALAHYLVMPLNLPPHYPPDNGGMECAVRELKTPLRGKILASGAIAGHQVQAWAEVLAHEQNHRSRDFLDGRIACRVFQVCFRMRSRPRRRILSASEERYLIGSTN